MRYKAMILHNLKRNDPDICNQAELYCRFNGDVFVDEKGNYIISENSSIVFDTLFNCLPSYKYKKYTVVDQVIITATVSGKGVLKIHERTPNNCSILSECFFDCEASQQITLTAELSDVSGAILYPEITATGECVLYNFSYSCNKEPCNYVNIALVICTFRREAYVYRNLSLMNANCITNSVFVIDNGKTLEMDKIEYQNAFIIPNKNYGGSGGFTRGLIEAYQSKTNFTHVLLMDDDITIDCDAIRKTEIFLSLLKPEWKNTSISGSMLRLDKQYIQYEAGARWENGKIVNLKQNLDLREVLNVVENEREEKIGYGAWWYMCMPISVVEKHGLPFPFFIKSDDIEYGLRTSENIVTLSGVSVWHEPFDGKYSQQLDYYIKRNELVLNAIHSKHDKMLAFKKLFQTLARYMLTYNYDCIPYLCQAYDDFFKGPDFFLNADDEKINSELLKKRFILKNDAELKNEFSMQYNDDMYLKSCHTKSTIANKFLQAITLGGYLIPNCFFHKGYNVTNIATSSPQCYFRWRRVLQYNPTEKKGKPVEINRKMLLKSIGLYLKYMFKIIFMYDKISNSYRKRMKEITSLEYWRMHLDIADKSDNK